MDYQLRRISTVPGSTMRILVDDPDPDDVDGGFMAGGAFEFEPAGQAGDRAMVNEVAARRVMGDPGLAQHFECQPAIPAGTDSGGNLSK